jgi:hypothetical protein
MKGIRLAVTPKKLDGKEVHVKLIEVVGETAAIPIITLVSGAVKVTSIIPLEAPDPRVQGARLTSNLLDPAVQP